MFTAAAGSTAACPGLVSYADALRNADTLDELRLNIKLQGKEAKDKNIMGGISHLQIT